MEAAWLVTISVCGWWRVQAVQATNTRNTVAAAEARPSPPVTRVTSPARGR